MDPEKPDSRESTRPVCVSWGENNQNSGLSMAKERRQRQRQAETRQLHCPTGCGNYKGVMGVKSWHLPIAEPFGLVTHHHVSEAKTEENAVPLLHCYLVNPQAQDNAGDVIF